MMLVPSSELVTKDWLPASQKSVFLLDYHSQGPVIDNWEWGAAGRDRGVNLYPYRNALAISRGFEHLLLLGILKGRGYTRF